MRNTLPDLPIDPPEPRDYDKEDEIFWNRADMDYEEWREDEILGRD